MGALSTKQYRFRRIFIMAEWHQMTKNQFPWEHNNVILACFDKDDPNIIEIFRCTCAEHGAYFDKNGGMLSIHEEGWIPFAFRDDDIPNRDDKLFPPLTSDYLIS